MLFPNVPQNTCCCGGEGGGSVVAMPGVFSPHAMWLVEVEPNMEQTIYILANT